MPLSMQGLLRQLKENQYKCPYDKVLLQVHHYTINHYEPFDNIYECSLQNKFLNEEHFIKALINEVLDFCNLEIKEETFACLNKALEDTHTSVRFLLLKNDNDYEMEVVENLKDLSDPMLYPENYTVALSITPYIEEENPVSTVLKSYPLITFQSKQQFCNWIDSEMSDYEDKYPHSYRTRIILTNKDNETQYEYRFLSDKLEKLWNRLICKSYQQSSTTPI